MRSIRYQQIAEEVRARLAGGEFGPGEVLPSESSLGAAYDASRVTIRKALEILRAEGLIDARQGILKTNKSVMLAGCLVAIPIAIALAIAVPISLLAGAIIGFLVRGSL